MFDFMADRVAMRQNIKKIAFKKIKMHLSGGYPSSKSPKRDDLMEMLSSGGSSRQRQSLDFASFVAKWYNAKDVDGESFCLPFLA